MAEWCRACERGDVCVKGRCVSVKSNEACASSALTFFPFGSTCVVDCHARVDRRSLSHCAIVRSADRRGINHRVRSLCDTSRCRLNRTLDLSLGLSPSFRSRGRASRSSRNCRQRTVARNVRSGLTKAHGCGILSWPSTPSPWLVRIGLGLGAGRADKRVAVLVDDLYRPSLPPTSRLLLGRSRRRACWGGGRAL